MLTSTLDKDLHIYYRRSTKWIALGQFDQAMEDDDECEWQMSDDQTHELHLLLVSLGSELCFGTDFYIRAHIMAQFLARITFLHRFLNHLIAFPPLFQLILLKSVLYRIDRLTL